MPSLSYDYDWIPAGGPGLAQTFVTSFGCAGCHDAGSTGLQFDMTMPNPHGLGLINLSPFATWRTSPMGLAGRDPFFFAQLASEVEFHPESRDIVETTCFGCHGVAGARQFQIDAHADVGRLPALRPRHGRRRAMARRQSQRRLRQAWCARPRRCHLHGLPSDCAHERRTARLAAAPKRLHQGAAGSTQPWYDRICQNLHGQPVRTAARYADRPVRAAEARADGERARQDAEARSATSAPSSAAAATRSTCLSFATA